jgi:hypothetical protein
MNAVATRGIRVKDLETEINKGVVLAVKVKSLPGVIVTAFGREMVWV